MFIKDMYILITLLVSLLTIVFVGFTVIGSSQRQITENQVIILKHIDSLKIKE